MSSGIQRARLVFRVLGGVLGATFLGLGTLSVVGGSIATSAIWLSFGAATLYVAFSGWLPPGLR